jgi:hypothetical protein
MPIETPPAFAANIVSREGADGQAWLDALPDLVELLLRRWNCSLVQSNTARSASWFPRYGKEHLPR